MTPPRSPSIHCVERPGSPIVPGLDRPPARWERVLRGAPIDEGRRTAHDGWHDEEGAIQEAGEAERDELGALTPPFAPLPPHPVRALARLLGRRAAPGLACRWAFCRRAGGPRGAVAAPGTCADARPPERRRCRASLSWRWSATWRSRSVPPTRSSPCALSKARLTIGKGIHCPRRGGGDRRPARERVHSQ